MKDTGREGQINCDGTNEIVCPYCGYEHTGSFDWFSYAYSEDTSAECVECGRRFDVTRRIKVTYSSYKLKDKAE